jgi:sec-independent protein translocase protein TatA
MAQTMSPVMMVGTTQLIIILVIVVVLFGGAKLSGLGKSLGSAIREFKDETKGMRGGNGSSDQSEDVVDAEVVEPDSQQSPAQMNSSAGSTGTARQSGAAASERSADGSDAVQRSPRAR